MYYLQVSENQLENLSFSEPVSTNSFFPRHNQTDHIHLGVPISYMDGNVKVIAAKDCRFVTYVSFKKNGNFWFRLENDSSTGKFFFPFGKTIMNLDPKWRIALLGLNILG